MQFYEVTRDKKRFLDLLLLADEQEEMIDRYLDRGKAFCARRGWHCPDCLWAHR